MRVEMVMPQMGESIAEAKVTKWRKAKGEAVKKDEIILDISTDKVDSEIPAPATGIIVDLLASEGDVVPVKSTIAVIETEGAGAAASTNGSHKASPPPPPPTPVQPASVVAPAVAATDGEEEESDKYYSPLVRSLAEKHGLSSAELGSIQGSGQGGRVTKQDVLNFVNSRGSSPAPARAAAVPPAAAPVPAKTPAPSTPAVVGSPRGALTLNYNPAEVNVVPMDNMRQAIAEHMVRSKHTSPHVYSIQEVDCHAIARWRDAHKKEFAAKEGFNLSFMPFFLEATVHALKQVPIVNSSVDGNTIVYKKSINLGCAVALPNAGLIVPVIKRAEERNFIGLARALNDLAERARTKKLSPDDVMGGSFTVTNVGSFGTVIGNPIINQPQVAILAIGVIKKRPVVVDDAIAIREICYLTLSYDHRIIDGGAGGSFLMAIRNYIEGWDMNRNLN